MRVPGSSGRPAGTPSRWSVDFPPPVFPLPHTPGWHGSDLLVSSAGHTGTEVRALLLSFVDWKVQLVAGKPALRYRLRRTVRGALNDWWTRATQRRVFEYKILGSCTRARAELAIARWSLARRLARRAALRAAAAFELGLARAGLLRLDGLRVWRAGGAAREARAQASHFARAHAHRRAAATGGPRGSALRAWRAAWRALRGGRAARRAVRRAACADALARWCERAGPAAAQRMRASLRGRVRAARAGAEAAFVAWANVGVARTLQRTAVRRAWVSHVSRAWRDWADALAAAAVLRADEAAAQSGHQARLGEACARALTAWAQLAAKRVDASARSEMVLRLACCTAIVRAHAGEPFPASDGRPAEGAAGWMAAELANGAAVPASQRALLLARVLPAWASLCAAAAIGARRDRLTAAADVAAAEGAAQLGLRTWQAAHASARAALMAAPLLVRAHRARLPGAPRLVLRWLARVRAAAAAARAEAKAAWHARTAALGRALATSRRRCAWTRCERTLAARGRGARQLEVLDAWVAARERARAEGEGAGAAAAKRRRLAAARIAARRARAKLGVVWAAVAAHAVRGVACATTAKRARAADRRAALRAWRGAAALIGAWRLAFAEAARRGCRRACATTLRGLSSLAARRGAAAAGDHSRAVRARRRAVRGWRAVARAAAVDGARRSATAATAADAALRRAVRAWLARCAPYQPARLGDLGARSGAVGARHGALRALRRLRGGRARALRHARDLATSRATAAHERLRTWARQARAARARRAAAASVAGGLRAQRGRGALRGWAHRTAERARGSWTRAAAAAARAMRARAGLRALRVATAAARARDTAGAAYRATADARRARRAFVRARAAAVARTRCGTTARAFAARRALARAVRTLARAAMLAAYEARVDAHQAAIAAILTDRSVERARLTSRELDAAQGRRASGGGAGPGGGGGGGALLGASSGDLQQEARASGGRLALLAPPSALAAAAGAGVRGGGMPATRPSRTPPPSSARSAGEAAARLSASHDAADTRAAYAAAVGGAPALRARPRGATPDARRAQLGTPATQAPFEGRAGLAGAFLSVADPLSAAEQGCASAARPSAVRWPTVTPACAPSSPASTSSRAPQPIVLSAPDPAVPSADELVELARAAEGLRRDAADAAVVTAAAERCESQEVHHNMHSHQ
ncbi:hypothetical protein T492DRAFT_843820 [Pavlovales sp. CCMP2436]|nr:hypothetical protein T492DRAFT_843820 [Pavlovales sp. CCMP2436]